MVHPLNSLLTKDTPWNWTGECQSAFQQTKTALASTNVLTHYSPKLSLRLAADASAYGVGTVISHVYNAGWGIKANNFCM